MITGNVTVTDYSMTWEKLKSVMVDVAIEVFIGHAKDLKTVLRELA